MYMLPPAIESIPKDIACNLLNLQIKDTPMLLQNQNLVAYLFIYKSTRNIYRNKYTRMVV